MPHFRWRGVTIEGQWHSGRLCSVSQEQLDARLFTRGIACTQVSRVRPYIFKPTVSVSEQAGSLETLALLLDAGMKVPEAFIVTAETLENPVLQEFFIMLAVSVSQGKDFDDFLLSGVFNPLMVHLMQVGYNTGTLSKILRLCALFLQAMYDIRKRMYAALLMPVITLIFVLFLLWAIFVFLIPSLTGLFSQLNSELPVITRLLLSISSCVSNPWFIGIGVGSIIFVSVCGYCLSKADLLVGIYVCLPVFGSLYMQWQRIMFMRSLVALLHGGICIADALQALASLTPSVYIRRYVTRLAREVAGGVQLSDALASIKSPLSTPLIIALVLVGQESNSLMKTLDAAAQRETALFLSSLQTVTLIVQPVLIIGLGMIVLMVIASVYLPLISIAHVV